MPGFSFSGHPFLLGFEQVERMLERAAKSGSDSYPPYNVEMRGGDAYRIVLAVAGFSEEAIEITLEDGNHLVVRGEIADGVETREYLHRGIAARRFQKSFVLAEGVEVTGAAMVNGLLHIDLERRPEITEVKRIEIRRR